MNAPSLEVLAVCDNLVSGQVGWGFEQSGVLLPDFGTSISAEFIAEPLNAYLKVRDDLVHDHLRNLNIQKSMGPDETHTRILEVSKPVLFNIFINDIDNGIECTLSRFSDYTKLSSAVDMPEGWDAIQRDLDELKWVLVNLMRFNKDECKVLHVDQGRPWYRGCPEDQSYSGLHRKKHGQQVEGGDSAPLLHSAETSPGVLQAALESPAQERHGPVGVGPEEGHKDDQRAGTPLL
ncbi:rna-directed dna polymerase from mobile element jockey-like [Limosa lapponica baueri]|uniref:Rna-directed dna polymerase from mobile element jockey-like n=1 Tax=Limosa lapponica baueri TaxID=1758121 RepID=A0A2I0U060_LIMLA|nr:rna-directed dna polymerase from mobile element jockey-like [Limosa lapponica baueri]